MPTEELNHWHTDAAQFAGSLLDADKSAPNFLTGAFGINDERRFAVYKNNVTVGLIRALESNFPAIVKLVGSQYFVGLARVFVEKHPPKTRILAEYGAAFPHFLAGFEPLAAYPYLGDVAQAEQHWREAFHASDAPPVTREQLTEIDAQSIALLRFKAHPAARLLCSQYAAGSIFRANRSDIPYPAFDPAKGEYVLITRPYYECSLRILNAADGAFVGNLLAGAMLHEAIDHALATGETFDLASSISSVLEAGAFCDYYINNAV